MIYYYIKDKNNKLIKNFKNKKGTKIYIKDIIFFRKK